MDDPISSAADAPDPADDPCPHCGQPVGDAWIVCAWCGTQIAAPAELAEGALLADGRYQVLGVIGRGGFGITYEVGDTRLKRRVAVKELFPESAVRHGSMVLTPPHARAAFRSSRDRFLREARVLARFTHPGIVRVYEVFEEHGTAYLVMERLSGRTLVDVLRARDEPFTEDEVLDVAGRVAAALRPVHAAGVLHRDVNPSNVMLTEHGRIVVIDFGLARDFDLDQTVGMTRMVTPGYAPLEQYRGEGRFGPTTDVYGLAATCYRLGTGRVPVGAIERDAGAELPAPHRLNPAISKPVSDAILDGLELEPAHRPQDLDAFLARMQVRWLPSAPRSLLLGTVGAQPQDLAAPGGDQAERPFGLVSPGPAVAAPTAIDPATELDRPASDLGATADPVTPLTPASLPATEVPAPVGSAATVVPGTSTTPMWTAVADPDRTEADPVAPAALLDGDRTWGPGQPVGAAPAPLLDPGPAGAAPAGRRKVTVPLAVLAIVAGSSAPVIIVGLMVLVVLPALATLGDSVVRRQRGAAAVDAGSGRSMPTGVWLPARFVRNVGASVLRTSPIIGVTAVLLATWYALGEAGVPNGLLDVLLRIIGGGAVAAILLGSREGSPRFRTGTGIDELAARGAPGGRTTERLVVGWLVVAIIVAGALLLAPDAYPMP